jgi:hypothetical protein
MLTPKVLKDTSTDAASLNDEVFKNIQITSQENMIIKSFERFYENKDNIALFISIINAETKISIRLIDHFVTKFSKNYKINYKIKDNNIEQNFNVYTSYKQQLKAFQKKHFDPFSRGDRIPYFIGDICVITTIGQLNFFKWFIVKNIYEYVKNNQEVIENDMNKKNKHEKKVKIKTKIKKNISYNIPTKQLINNYNNYKATYDTNINQLKTNKIVVSFNFN